MLKEIWLAFFDKMKDKKRVEILLKVIERVYSKNPGMQTLSVIETVSNRYMQRRRCVTRAGIFFAFLCCWLYRYGLSEQKLFVCEGQLIFNGDQEILEAGILRVKN